MNDFKERLVHLHHCPGASWKTSFTILKKDPQLNSLYDEQLLKTLFLPLQQRHTKGIKFPSLKRYN